MEAVTQVVLGVTGVAACLAIAASVWSAALAANHDLDHPDFPHCDSPRALSTSLLVSWVSALIAVALAFVLVWAFTLAVGGYMAANGIRALYLHFMA